LFSTQRWGTGHSEPQTIITGLKIDHNKHFKLEFGAYVQIHEEHDNSLTAHTTGAITLRPTTGTTQGTHYFLNINSGWRVSCNDWMALTMPDEIIQIVHRLVAAILYMKIARMLKTPTMLKLLIHTTAQSKVTLTVQKLQE